MKVSGQRGLGSLTVVFFFQGFSGFCPPKSVTGNPLLGWHWGSTNVQEDLDAAAFITHACARSPRLTKPSQGMAGMYMLATATLWLKKI